ncbi:hypothetical protein NESM_000041000 [Novymonas esmeraldas]|uniref:Uncharacterized protein n=1 Tax=Novymonas esmeraldas TaxID=1808958 RepID=A0AAW0F0L4_9TRYP
MASLIPPHEASPVSSRGAALMALHEALLAVDRLETHHFRSPAASLSSGSLLIGVAEQPTWEALVVSLQRLVDRTRPCGGDDAVGLPTEDGRAALLGWVAAPASTNSTTTTTTTAAAAPYLSACETDSVAACTRLFRFLARLAALAPDGTATQSCSPAAMPDAAPPAGATTVTKHTSKSQQLAADIIESVLVYGSAVASNLSSAIADDRLPLQWRRRQPSRQRVDGDVGGPAQDAVSLPQAMWVCVVSTARLYHREKQLLHLLLSALANVVTWPSLSVDADTCTALYQLVMLHYTSSAIVGAWVAMLCNLVAAHPAASVPTLLQLGVVADVQRLALATSPADSAAAERTVQHALQLLSNIAVFAFRYP